MSSFARFSGYRLSLLSPAITGFSAFWRKPFFGRSLISLALLSGLGYSFGAYAAAPTPLDDVLLTPAGTVLSFDYLLLNDSDPDGDVLSVSATTPPSIGALSDLGGGAYNYTPAVVGDDSFNYSAFDGSSGTSATVRVSVNATFDAESARDDLLNGVTSLADPGGPGHMVVWGPTAYAVSNYPGQDERDPMLAAATMGSGKIIAMPDHQWLHMNSYGADTSTGNFYRNSVAWLVESTSKAIKVVTLGSNASTWLSGDGFTNVVVSSIGSLASDLVGADVLITWPGSNPSQSVVDEMTAFTKAGGGLFICDYGIGYDWWWGKETSDIGSNRILRDAGIAFVKKWPHGGGAQTINRASGQVTDDEVLAVLANPESYTALEKERAGEVFNGLNDAVGDDDTLQARLDVEFWDRIGSLNPTPATPISNSLDRALLNREAEILRNLPANEVTAHRTAEDVYGAIPGSAPRISKTVVLDATRSRWHATGLYAVPGELVTVTVPASMVGLGYKIRINSHTDTVSRTTLERLPYVHRSYSIDATSTQVACAFGGPIFIDFGGSAWSGAPSLGNVNIGISNAIEHPYFDLDQHTDLDWINGLRDKPGPYAVFVSENMMFCQRSSESASLTTPTALMTWWNQVVLDQDWIGGRVKTRASSEFTNVDVQNSAGAAHAGYPVQAYDKHWGNLANYASLAMSGSWGDFHELGHNHQRGWWNFGPDGEVTVNIFSNYNKETLASEPTTSGWGWSADPVQVINTAVSNVAPGGTYVSKSSRWSFWFQLADGFGWDVYREVLMSYELDNQTSSLPTLSTSVQKQDEFYIRWSQECGYDMFDFMINTWGMEVTTAAQSAVATLSLPDWMPVVGSVTSGAVVPGGSLLLDLEGGAHSMDGVVNLTGLINPANGILVDNSDGTVSYSPDPGFDGDDTFTYSLQSSSGNTVATVVTVTVAPISDLLLAHWNFDENRGSTTVDSSVNGLDGTLQGSAAFAPSSGVKGGALDLNGSGQVSTPALGVTTDAITITGWIKRNGAQSAFAGLFFTREGSSDATGFNMYDATTLGYHWNGSSATWSFSSGLVVPDNQWTFVALVVEAMKATIYMHDGFSMQSKVNAIKHPSITFDATHYLGYDTANTSRRFDGLMDDWRAYGGALSESLLAGIRGEILNKDPTLDNPIGALVVVEGASNTVLDLSSVFSDPDVGDSLTFSVEGNSTPTLLGTSVAGSILTLDYLSGQPGATFVTVRATDLDGAYVEDLFEVTVQLDSDGDGDPDLTDPDDDNDEMVDAWELAHSLDPFLDDASVDADLDGNDNWSEFIADTDPQDPASVQTFSIAGAPVTGDAVVSFRTSANRRYAVEYHDDLGPAPWTDLGSSFWGTGSEMSVTDSTSSTRRFYRLNIELP